MDAARELAQLVQRGGQAPRLSTSGCSSGSSHAHAQEPQLECERDELLLCAVVEIALDAPARLVGGLDDAQRETRSSSRRARRSAFRRSLSIASDGAVAAAWTSSGVVSRAASWTIAATRWPSRSTAVHARPDARVGQLDGAPGLVDEDPRSGSQ